MNPHQKNKIDITSLTPEEQRLFRLYGKLPSKSDHFAKHLKERKYFDSGDYAMSKAGKGDKLDTGSVGSQHPVPENIPHLSSPGQATTLNGGPGHQHHHSISTATAGHQSNINTSLAGSPVKESSLLLNSESSNDDSEAAAAEEVEKKETVKENAQVTQDTQIQGTDAKKIPIRK
ncbi:camp-regulated phosphoprotein/endosulfine conserved region-domain-containing protein [Xylaria sp. CBS 124048]|nr:camp-regulated phosphoprotein/endosulfine conserved region-domain-containing protein [Xylaria sp. CBS 124048]